MSRHKQILLRHLPEGCVDAIYAYLVAHGVRFHITRNRRSKLGDYRCPQNGRDYHEISVNGDLNRYYFLLVLLHEMAHLENFLVHHNRVLPHGHEWQEQYRRLLVEYLAHFPQDVGGLIGRYVKRIPLNRSVGKQIEATLHKYDSDYDPERDLLLRDLPMGSHFVVKTRPNMELRVEEKRRTRYRCTDVHTGAAYLVAGDAPVVKC